MQLVCSASYRRIASFLTLAMASGCPVAPPISDNGNGNGGNGGTVDFCESVACEAGYICNAGTGQCVLESTCSADLDCSDDEWCNGRELCVFGQCLPGDPPCALGLACDAIGQTCHDGGPGPTGETLLLDLGDAVTIELVRIASGSFLMGTNASDYAALERSQPAHGVSITKDFYIGRFEVTQAQWLAVMGDNPSHFTGDANLPVESITWVEAVEFCDILSAMTGYDIRLPSEAEWEYACRGGSQSAFNFGSNAADLPGRAWFVANSESATHAVGTRMPNFWGLYDLHGNVLEWCQDPWHPDYDGAPGDERVWTTDGDPMVRVLRGGAWYNADYQLRSAYRTRYDLDRGYYGIGFRIVAGT